MSTKEFVRGRVIALCLLACAAAYAASPKRLLVFSRCEGFRHSDSIKTGNATIKNEAAQRGYTVDFNDDYAALKLENLKRYDALVLNNTTCMKTKQNPFVSPSLVKYVEEGGGIAFIHSAADNFYDAPECSHLVGGRFDGHPWYADPRAGTWKFKIEDREHPVNAAFKDFKDGTFFRSEEIYQHSSPYYDRSKLHILISLDFSDLATRSRRGKKRLDDDYAVSWVRAFGKGRVFYTSFAHDGRAWNAKDTKEHIFAGIAYCAGTLKVDDKPVDRWAKGDSNARCTLIGEYAIARNGAEIAKHVEDADPAVAKAAALALGRLGCPKALACLAAMVEKPCDDKCLKGTRMVALGAALGEMTLRGQAKDAAAVAKKVFDNPAMCDNLRAVAAVTLVAADANFFSTALADKSANVRKAVLARACKVPAELLAKELAAAKCPCLKQALLARIKVNNAKAAAPAVRALLKDADESVAAQAVVTIAQVGGPDDVAALAEARKRNGAIADAAKTALTDMPDIGGKILELAAQDASYLDIAAKRGESKFVANWAPFITSKDESTRKKAWRAVGKLTGADVLGCVLGWYGQVQDAERDVATTALSRVMRDVPATARDAKLLAAWKAAQGDRRTAYTKTINDIDGFDALNVWEQAANDAACATDAKKAYVVLANQALAESAKGAIKPNKARWTAKSDRDGGNVANAFDGNASSRWTSMMNPKGVYYTLDFGETLFVNAVTLDTVGSPKDTPCGCDVFASLDGETWKGPVASCGKDTVNQTEFTLNCTAKALKFVARESRPGLHWSIHEIDVKTGIDAARVEKIRTTAAKFLADLTK